MLRSVFPNSKHSEGINVLVSCLFGLTSKSFPHSLLTTEMDRLRKNPLCFLQREIYLSPTLHLLIFMLFHILPIPLPEIKLGLLLEALLVLRIPRLTMLHSVNTYIKRSRKQTHCSTTLNFWEGVATFPDNGKFMHTLFQIF